MVDAFSALLYGEQPGAEHFLIYRGVICGDSNLLLDGAVCSFDLSIAVVVVWSAGSMLNVEVSRSVLKV